MTEMDEEVLFEELECPVCNDYMSPPIYLCVTGHSVCRSCRSLLTSCSLCQKKLTNSRNLVLEAYAQKLNYPCLYNHLGCTKVLTCTQRKVHESSCPHGLFGCAMENCAWRGPAEDVFSHWTSKKRIRNVLEASNDLSVKIKPKSSYVNILRAHDKLFWFKGRQENGVLYFAVQFIGSAADAEGFCYNVEAFALDEGRFKFSDRCKSVFVSNDDLFRRKGCIQFPESVAQKYSLNGVFQYTLSVESVRK